MTDPLTPPLTEAEVEALDDLWESGEKGKREREAEAVRRIRAAERERVLADYEKRLRDVIFRACMEDPVRNFRSHEDYSSWLIAALRGTEGA